MTIAAFEAAFSQSTTDRIRFELALANSHEKRLALVERAIDWISQELTKSRHLKVGLSEDQITIEIVLLLKAMGFQASHDTQYGGHCDIVVEGKQEFLWIAEAKIDTSNTWIMKGFSQLDTRYSTGLPGQDAGEILLYCRKPKSKETLEKWLEFLCEKRSDVEALPVSSGTLSRRSVHEHKATATLFKVRHTPITLYFKPEDT